MIQEYLIRNLGEAEYVEAYNPVGVKKRMCSAAKGSCWSVRFSVEGENERAAKQLSEVDEYLVHNIHLTAMSCGCYAYFHRKLYPLINEFELKLRQLLYVKSAMNHDDESAKNISDLESKSFGDLFTLLFIDVNFMSAVKNAVKNRNRESFIKQDIIAAIEKLEEITLWDKLMDKDVVPTLRKQFVTLQTYRNEVMHAKRITWHRYKEIKRLYKSVNSEIDIALRAIEFEDGLIHINPAFNQTLAGAIRLQDSLAALSESIKPFVEQYQQLSEKLVLCLPSMNEIMRLKGLNELNNTSCDLRESE